MANKPKHSHDPIDFLSKFFHMKNIYRKRKCHVLVPLETGDTRVGVFDIPNKNVIDDCGSYLTSWLYAIQNRVSEGKNTVVVLTTHEELTDKPDESWVGQLAKLIFKTNNEKEVNVIDAILVGSDGWATFQKSHSPKLRNLDEIYLSPTYLSKDIQRHFKNWGKEETAT